MNFLDIMTIAERDMGLLNPTSPEKILRAGELAGLGEGKRVIEYGAGNGEVLAIWAEMLGVSGVGIELRETAAARARQRLEPWSDQIEIVQGDGAEYEVEPGAFDVAACIGASFIWEDGYPGALRAMKEAISPGDYLIIGEPYWLRSDVPDLVRIQMDMPTEYGLYQTARAEGYQMVTILDSTRPEWDAYVCANWRGLIDWLDANPDHPEHAVVEGFLHEDQAEYFQYMREYVGWMMLILRRMA